MDRWDGSDEINEWDCMEWNEMDGWNGMDGWMDRSLHIVYLVK